MIKYFFFVFSFFTIVSCLSQEDSNSEVLKVKVQLITDLDSVVLPPNCGILASRITFDFEIVTVIEGVYSKKNIPISILCPRESIESQWLGTGKEYTFRLKPRFGINEIKLGEPTKEVDLGDYEILSDE